MIRHAVALCLAASSAFAGEAPRSDLAFRVEKLGQHETDTTRHAIELDACEMTIFFWKTWDDRGKALHSVHHVDLRGYDPLAQRPPKRREGWFALPGADGTMSEVLMIEMQSHDYLVSELAMRSEPSPPYEMSDRVDQDTFVKKRRLFHGLRFDGLTEGRMEELAALLDQYHVENCAQTS